MTDPIAALRHHGPDPRADAEPPAAAPGTGSTSFAAAPAKAPLYWRVLRLRHIRPNGWQRAVLVEGVLAVAITLVLADVASAWTLLVLPVASVAIVKGHDILTGLLRGGSGNSGTAPPPRG
jgi:hypothetical protein